VKNIIIALSFLATPALAQQPQMPNLEEVFFKQFDTNQDGRVDKAEFLKPTEAQFDHMDTNKDGALDQAEVKAFNDEMKQRMQEMQRQMQQQGGMQNAPRR
jgi:Ca2+-binding EF-hand superfamily protein